MSDKTLIAMVEDKPVVITVDLRKMRMRDLNELNKSADTNDMSAMIPIISRVTGLTPDQVWDLDFETIITIQNQINMHMNDVLKKTNAGS